MRSLPKDHELESQVTAMRDRLRVESPVPAESQARWRQAVAVEFAQASQRRSAWPTLNPALLAPIAVALIAYAASLGLLGILALLGLGVAYGSGASHLMGTLVMPVDEA